MGKRLGRTPINSHIFLVDWPKIHANIEDLVEIVTPYTPRLTILDNPEHYFSEQWAEMLKQFSGDYMLWIMGDVTLPKKFWNLKEKIDNVFLNLKEVGVYSPNIEQTFHTWDTTTFTALAPNLLEVPCAEPNVWAIRRTVLEDLPVVDVAKNRFGWGVDLMVSASAELKGFKVVRDYNFTAGHPNFTGYDEVEAERQMNTWRDSLPADIASVMKRRWDWGLQYNLNWKRLNETKNS